TVGQPRGPVRSDEARASDSVDVVGETERDDVCFQPVDNGPRLLAGAAVRLPNRDLYAGLLGVALGERRVDRLVELAGGIVGDVEDLHLHGRHGRGRAAAGRRVRIVRLFLAA